MQEARDEVYCHLVARRAVARAALHLGLNTLSRESLDVLASVMLEYMSRIGKVLACSVEASGRSSAHVNVLDSIRAIEFCTAPAVQRTHLDPRARANNPANSAVITDPSVSITTTTTAAVAGVTATATTFDFDESERGGGAVATTAGAAAAGMPTLDPRDQLTWRGLASFLFGPNWLNNTTTTTISTSASSPLARRTTSLITATASSPPSSSAEHLQPPPLESTTTSSAGGKVGPTVSLMTNGGGGGTIAAGGSGAGLDVGGGAGGLGGTGGSGVSMGGWDAPYPGEIPLFPTASSSVSNPHPFVGNPSIYETLHTSTTMDTTITTTTSKSSAITKLVTPTSDPETGIMNQNEDNDYDESIMVQIPDNVFTDESSWGCLPGRNHNTGGNEYSSNGNDIPNETTKAKGSSSTTDPVPMDEGTTHKGNEGSTDDDADGNATADPGRSKKRKLGAVAGGGGSSSSPSGGLDLDETSKKRPRALSLGGGGTSGSAAENHDDTTAHSHVSPSLVGLPIFYPPLPRRGHAVRLAILDADEPAAVAPARNVAAPDSAAPKLGKDTLDASSSGPETTKKSIRTDTTSNKPVRAALVQLGQYYYWGSGWDRDDLYESPITQLAVPLGNTAGSSANGGGGTSSAGGGGSGDGAQPVVVKPQIVPLGRASGSRVSRILEGSMDATSMP